MSLVGTEAPDFSLPDQFGNVFTLSEHLDKRILLAFYPKDNSPVCTMQFIDYSENFEIFFEHDIQIVGISSDSVESHKSFCEKLNDKMILLSDKDKSVCKAFNALSLLGFTKRKLVLICPNRKIRYEKATVSIFFTDSNQIIEDLKKLKIFTENGA